MARRRSPRTGRLLRPERLELRELSRITSASASTSPRQLRSTHPRLHEPCGNRSRDGDSDQLADYSSDECGDKRARGQMFRTERGQRHEEEHSAGESRCGHQSLPAGNARPEQHEIVRGSCRHRHDEEERSDNAERPHEDPRDRRGDGRSPWPAREAPRQKRHDAVHSCNHGVYGWRSRSYRRCHRRYRQRDHSLDCSQCRTDHQHSRGDAPLVLRGRKSDHGVSAFVDRIRRR